jgi:hypothetical protein
MAVSPHQQDARQPKKAFEGLVSRSNSCAYIVILLRVILEPSFVSVFSSTSENTKPAFDSPEREGIKGNKVKYVERRPCLWYRILCVTGHGLNHSLASTSTVFGKADFLISGPISWSKTWLFSPLFSVTCLGPDGWVGSGNRSDADRQNLKASFVIW